MRVVPVSAGSSAAGSNPRRSSSWARALRQPRPVGALGRAATPVPAGATGGAGVGAARLRQRAEQTRQEHVGGRVEAQPGRAGRQGVAMLGASDPTAVDRLDLEQAGVAQALEVQADGVRVQPERLGEVRGRARRRGSGQLPVERVAGLVAQGLQHLEVHALTVDA